ncbi:HCP-like protein [Gonapodya prolifera JEL478]|uniref:HCP-like protein n=1 Tax=Gonapodya prolifera (strain JEL478) TaxID=1344416 RepID=A0A139A8P9_GONPJ|nr:HCP-like protein [Gonapodya prolifera JEL478]|eukprot:KXS13058.1 HCP-like protein [Gonapodya prolifera JEL478]
MSLTTPMFPFHAAQRNAQLNIKATSAKQIPEQIQTQMSKAIGGMFQRGLMLEKDLKMNEAITSYILAASRMDKESMYKLGTLLESGEHVPLDYSHARTWYILAARGTGDEPHVGAQYKLGYFYEFGLCGESKMDKARKLYKLAAEKFHADVQYKAAYFLEHGIGGESNMAEARKYYTLAANQNHSESQYELGGGNHLNRNNRKSGEMAAIPTPT